MSEQQKTPTPDAPGRREAMALLARATRAELEHPLARHWRALEVRELKPAEAGLIMVRGRIGGDGAPFNLGEASVTRCVVETGNGRRGHAVILGRDQKKARLAAILDALWQDEAEQAAVEREVLAPVRQRLPAKMRAPWPKRRRPASISSPWCAENRHERPGPYHAA